MHVGFDLVPGESRSFVVGGSYGVVTADRDQLEGPQAEPDQVLAGAQQDRQAELLVLGSVAYAGDYGDHALSLFGWSSSPHSISHPSIIRSGV